MDYRQIILTMSYEDFLQALSDGEHCPQAPEPPECPLPNVFSVLSGKWRMAVIYQLSRQGTVRFGALRKSIPGITNTMLTTVLKELEEYGIVSRRQYNEIPPHVEYALPARAEICSPFCLKCSNGARSIIEH